MNDLEVIGSHGITKTMSFIWVFSSTNFISDKSGWILSSSKGGLALNGSKKYNYMNSNFKKSTKNDMLFVFLVDFIQNDCYSKFKGILYPRTKRFIIKTANSPVLWQA